MANNSNFKKYDFENLMKWKDLNKYKDRLEDMKRMSPFQILGVEESSSKEIVKKAYLEMMKKYHPDISHEFMASHNQEIIKLVNDAYDKIIRGKK